MEEINGWFDQEVQKVEGLKNQDPTISTKVQGQTPEIQRLESGKIRQ